MDSAVVDALQRGQWGPCNLLCSPSISADAGEVAEDLNAKLPQPRSKASVEPNQLCDLHGPGEILSDVDAEVSSSPSLSSSQMNSNEVSFPSSCPLPAPLFCRC